MVHFGLEKVRERWDAFDRELANDWTYPEQRRPQTGGGHCHTGGT